MTTSEGLELELVSSYKYLGVWIDSTLSISQHISKLQAKVKSRLGFLTLIQRTILPILDYGDVIYTLVGKGALERQICHQCSL